MGKLDNEENFFGDLFINKEYRVKPISIPVHVSKNEREETTQQQTTLTVDLLSSPAASTDLELTGQVLWPVSVLLAHYVASSRGQDIITKKNIVELGAGCGLPGICASRWANAVLMTDGNDLVLDLLEKNCTSFADEHADHAIMTVVKMIWGCRDDLDMMLAKMPIVDAVIAADVVQWPSGKLFIVTQFIRSPTFR